MTLDGFAPNLPMHEAIVETLRAYLSEEGLESRRRFPAVSTNKLNVLLDGNGYQRAKRQTVEPAAEAPSTMGIIPTSAEREMLKKKDGVEVAS